MKPLSAWSNFTWDIITTQKTKVELDSYEIESWDSEVRGKWWDYYEWQSTDHVDDCLSNEMNSEVDKIYWDLSDNLRIIRRIFNIEHQGSTYSQIICRREHMMRQ